MSTFILHYFYIIFKSHIYRIMNLILKLKTLSQTLKSFNPILAVNAKRRNCKMIKLRIPSQNFAYISSLW